MAAILLSSISISFIYFFIHLFIYHKSIHIALGVADDIGHHWFM